MTREYANFRLDDIFHVKSGDYHATKDLDPGDIPLVSCGDTNNGVIGYYDIPEQHVYSHVITSAYNGQPLTTKFHPYRFGAKDDVAVLLPRGSLRETTLLYLAALLNRTQWRYSYGRKCFREKMKKVSVRIPVVVDHGTMTVDEDYIAGQFVSDFRESFPQKTNTEPIQVPVLQWQEFGVQDLFHIQRGDFHSLSVLEDGVYPTVSRVSLNNGVVGYYDRPDDAEIYPKGCLTVSTVAGDAFVQVEDFIATDNVIVCKPKSPFRISTLFFLAFLLNHQKWRYFYGRQCYITKFSKIKVQVPVANDGSIDEDSIGAVVRQTGYWREVEKRFETTQE